MSDPRDVALEAREAERLLSSPLLQEGLAELRREAIEAAIHGESLDVRERARMSVVAIDGLVDRLRARLDARLVLERRRQVATRQAR